MNRMVAPVGVGQLGAEGLGALAGGQIGRGGGDRGVQRLKVRLAVMGLDPGPDRAEREIVALALARLLVDRINAIDLFKIGEPIADLDSLIGIGRQRGGRERRVIWSSNVAVSVASRSSAIAVG